MIWLALYWIAGAVTTQVVYVSHNHTGIPWWLRILIIMALWLLWPLVLLGRLTARWLP